MQLPIFCLLLPVILVSSGLSQKSAPPKPTSHTIRTIEGWKVRVDDRLLSGPDALLGKQALRMLSNQLFNITLALPEPRLKALRKVMIEMDQTCGELKSEQYHPSADWLKEHGYPTELAKCVHIPDASYFSAASHQRQQPWAVMHELAHSYHDQVLSFEEPRILEQWKKVVKNGHFDNVLHIDGGRVKHYALTDQKEFFAEMTEVYLGMNDFYPFNHAELKVSEPEIYALMHDIWETDVK